MQGFRRQGLDKYEAFEPPKFLKKGWVPNKDIQSLSSTLVTRQTVNIIVYHNHKFCQLQHNAYKKIEEDVVEKIRNLISKKAEIKEEMDTSLIGGLKIQIGDLLIDGSIRAKLNKLRQSLT